jgi:2-dehydro-3-deoxy-D-arabinonate dehydratase
LLLYKTRNGWVTQLNPGSKAVAVQPQERLTTREDLYPYLQSVIESGAPNAPGLQEDLMAPIEDQEVWAAGVTYFRSRDARMAESKEAGGGDFYSRVYEAARPELFFKATPSRVVGTQDSVHIRSDSRWNVPEPELALLISPRGAILGYTIGNDMSSRDIEGENPLYLPQAKVYDRSCALGPGILVSPEPLPPQTRIMLAIDRAGSQVFDGATTLAEMKRRPSELVEFLFRDNIFPNGCFLLTGTGIVPPESLSLQHGDEIRISIDSIGSLRNTVA